MGQNDGAAAVPCFVQRLQQPGVLIRQPALRKNHMKETHVLDVVPVKAHRRIEQPVGYKRYRNCSRSLNCFIQRELIEELLDLRFTQAPRY